MRIEPVHIEKQNNLVRDYRNQKKMVTQYFDYGIMDFEKRVQELTNRTFKRQQVAEVLTRLNKAWGAPSSTFENIERLKSEDSVVVIGGQQAGLLTGPLYSINKIISIIQLAKQQEKQLGIPVIPVFWIAGEDHDFEEINHIFIHQDSRMKKYKVQQRILDKRSVSEIDLNRDDIDEWVDIILKQMPETQYTKDIRRTILSCLENATSYVDFFANFIFKLFQEEGLVLMDSGNEFVRRLENDYFTQMITKREEISSGVFTAHKELHEAGYAISLDVSPHDGNLFYHKDQERILLMINSEGNWVGKQNEICLTTEELISIAEHSPEVLSNNVVTRPLMQDLVFPTLAFIGGPGEISYWSVLKPAFHALNMKMPPVVPRLSFTYVERKIHKLLQRYEITPTEAINGGVLQRRKAWFKKKINPPIEETVTDIKAVIENAHKPLRDIATTIRADLGDLAEKNLGYLIRDIEFLEKRITKALEQRFEKELSEFDLLENTLHPNGLQERMWNPLPFLNDYGLDFFNEINGAVCSFDEDHYIVYI
ncbi:bacillithiol biosynthesis cysteine-adding enzyme BshC [Ornithinibacillus xuwenensis]|uniref:Putative cysteine ligase BshC n=1 Tax=Ornithinibacillus xuwenensis TaxID=3144668 RepID=A0ABU9XGA9_9BACI